MIRDLVIDHSREMIRAGVIEDGSLCEIHHEVVHQRKLTECIFLGRIQAIKPALNAAFVDIGEKLNAFLPLSDSSGYRCGDEIIVQGSAVQSVETKGLRVTDTLNLAGKWVVLVPGARGVRISKKIKDSELRESLIRIMVPHCPDGYGLIIRTASSEVTEELLLTEVHELTALWERILLKAKGMRNPGILHEPLGVTMQLVRDIGSTLHHVITNSRELSEQFTAAKVHGWLPESTEIRLYEEQDCLLCDVFSFDAQIDKALKKRVWLPSGGYLVFDACEALTVIDVNSGKMVIGKEVESTALQVNLEAANEIARQLRLRDIGGIIIVDYIDMQTEANQKLLLQEIRQASLRDRSQIEIGGLTKFGLVEMTRKRKGEQLSKVLQANCKSCSGQGVMISADETARRILRQIKRKSLSGQRGPFLVRCANAVFSALSNMNAPCDAVVYICSENGRHIERFDIEQLDILSAAPKGAVQIEKG